MELQTKLHNLIKGSLSIEAYVQAIRTIGDELQTCGNPMTENDLTLALLRGLGPQYNAFYASTSQLLYNLTFDDVAANLNTFDLHLSRKFTEQVPSEFPPTANYTHTHPQDTKNMNRGGRNGRGRGRGQRTTSRCQLCFKQGHRVINCYERFNRNFQQPNYKEFVNTHNEGQSSQQPKVNLTNTSNTIGQQNTWYPDSGSTHHVTNDITNLQQSTIYTSPDQLYVGNGQGLSISSIGSSQLLSKSKRLLLNNILHVPHITKNLLSIHKFTTENNVFVEFHPFFCLVKDIQSGRILMRGEHKDGLYLLNFLQTFSSFLGEKVSPDIWHNRLGHPHFRVFQRILKDFEHPLTHKIYHSYCDACCSSKAHKLPFNISLKKNTRPLELFHSDLWGPAPSTSHFGNWYYVIFVDDFSKYTWLLPLKNKKRCLAYFLRISCQSGKTIFYKTSFFSI